MTPAEPEEGQINFVALLLTILLVFFAVLLGFRGHAQDEEDPFYSEKERVLLLHDVHAPERRPLELNPLHR
jgi:hypothetical protein